MQQEEDIYAPDLREYRLAKNQSEVMLSNHVKILNEHDRQVKIEGNPRELRAKFPNADAFYKRLFNLIYLKKVYIK